MRMRHQRPILAARLTVLDPRRILVPGYADAAIKGTAAQPTEQHIFVVQFIAVFALFFVHK